MPRVLLTMDPTPALREVAAAALPEAAWAEDGTDPHAEVLVSLWPRKEMRRLGVSWDDFDRLRLVKLITAGANHAGWSTYPRDVPLATTPGAMGAEIAEHVLALVLAWARGIVRSTRAIAEGRFALGLPVRTLRGMRVGLVGFGGIGQATARLMHGLGAEVRAVSRSGQGPTEHADWIGTMERLPALLAESQVVVLALPLVQETEGLVDRRFLAHMGEDVLLVNVARGPIVVEEDLYAWLQAAPDRRSAALDVWWTYPKEDGHPFHQPFHTLPNVLMTPHDAPNVPGFQEKMLAAALADVRAFLEDGTLRHVQSPAAYRLRREGDGR